MSAWCQRKIPGWMASLLATRRTCCMLRLPAWQSTLIDGRMGFRNHGSLWPKPGSAQTALVCAADLLLDRYCIVQRLVSSVVRHHKSQELLLRGLFRSVGWSIELTSVQTRICQLPLRLVDLSTNVSLAALRYGPLCHSLRLDCSRKRCQPGKKESGAIGSALWQSMKLPAEHLGTFLILYNSIKWPSVQT